MDSLTQFQDTEFGLCKILHHNKKEFQDVCLFASHTSLSFLPEYVYYYLEAVKKAGLSIVFISSSEISKNDLERLATLADIIIEKENRGTDFGAWCAVLRWLNFGKQFQTLYLCNDSVFGPFFPLHVLHNHFLSLKEDIIGITDSYQGIEYHIQSYFVGIKKNVLNSPIWEKFWAEMSFHNDKSKVIEFYEIGLTQSLIKSGFSHFAWCQWPQKITYDILLNKISQSETLRRNWLNRLLIKKEQIFSDINPCSYLWEELITHCNNPFIKRELFTFPHLYHEYQIEEKYFDTLNKNTSYPTDLIKKFQVQFNFHKAWKRTQESNRLNISLSTAALGEKAKVNKIDNFIFQSLEPLFAKITANAFLRKSEEHAQYFIDNKVQSLSLFLNEENNKVMECILLYVDKSIASWPSTQLTAFKALLRQTPNIIVIVSDKAAGYIVSALLQLKSDNILTEQHFLSPTHLHKLIELFKQLYTIYLSGDELGNLYLKPSLASVIADAVYNYNTTNFCKPEELNGHPQTDVINHLEPGVDKEYLEFLRIREKYSKLYEVTPWWYKKIGQAIKLFTGNKRLKIKITDKGGKEQYNPTPEDIAHWYFIQYEVLPKWYKNLGAFLIKPKSKNE